MTEFRPGRFQILPTIIKNLLIINVLFFLAQMTYDHVVGNDLEVANGILSKYFALHSFYSPLFRPWQLVTHMFMHGSAMHIFGNMFALWLFGSVLENQWGPKRFLVFYLVCGVGAALVHLASLGLEYHSMVNSYNNFAQNPTISNFDALVNNEALTQTEAHDRYSITRNWATNPEILRNYASAILEKFAAIINYITDIPTVGASGAVFGCLAAFGYLFPNSYITIGKVVLPYKTKWIVLCYIGFQMLMVLRHSSGGIARWAHLGGALVGFLLVYFWNRTNRRSFY